MFSLVGYCILHAEHSCPSFVGRIGIVQRQQMKSVPIPVDAIACFVPCVACPTKLVSDAETMMKKRA